MRRVLGLLVILAACGGHAHDLGDAGQDAGQDAGPPVKGTASIFGVVRISGATTYPPLQMSASFEYAGSIFQTYSTQLAADGSWRFSNLPAGDITVNPPAVPDTWLQRCCFPLHVVLVPFEEYDAGTIFAYLGASKLQGYVRYPDGGAVSGATVGVNAVGFPQAQTGWDGRYLMNTLGGTQNVCLAPAYTTCASAFAPWQATGTVPDLVQQ